MTRRIPWAVVVLALGACKFEASCGGSTVNTDNAEKLIAGTLKDQIGVDTKVSCPGSVKAKSGDTFECTAQVDGVDLVITVEQTSDTGDVSYRVSRGYLFSELLEQNVTEKLGSSGILAKVDCGPRFRLSKPGSSFTCTATDTTGQTGTIDVEVTSADGNISWKLREN